MPKFVFQLDGVLRQRTHAEQQRQREVAAAQSQLTQIQAELRALNDSIEASTRSLRQDHLTGRLDMNFLAAHRRYTAAMQRKGQAMAQKMAAALRGVETARLALAEAAKQRKVIEKLRERQKERWLADAARKEAAELDEIGMQMSYDRPADGEDSGAGAHTTDEVMSEPPRLSRDTTVRDESVPDELVPDQLVPDQLVPGELVRHPPVPGSFQDEPADAGRSLSAPSRAADPEALA